MKTRLPVSIVLLLVSQLLFADVWLPPKTACYYSSNHKYCVKVFPEVTPKKYAQWYYAKPRRKSKFTVADTTIIPCHAIMYQLNGVDSTVVWEKRLVNSNAPCECLVNDDGKYLTTFDDWHMVGTTDNVMVIYDAKGEMIKRYKLEEMTPYKVSDLMHSISSIAWRKRLFVFGHQLEIYFINDKDVETKRVYDLDGLKFLE